MTALPHGEEVSGGMLAANAVRRKYIESLVAGEVSFVDVVRYSKAKEGDERYLGALRLFEILRARRGWTGVTALEVLTRNGFDAKTTIRTIRRNERKVELFASLLKSTADRWRTRPAMPDGWPWNGRLALLTDSAGVPLPAELAATEYEETEVEVEANSEEIYRALLADDEDES